MTELVAVGALLSRAPAEFRLVRHIEVFEGPLISEFRVVPDGDPYLFIWRDRNEQFNRWLAIRTSKRDITLYESLEFTMRELMERAVTAFLVDVNAKGQFERWFAAAIEQLPEKYRAAQDSWFDPTLRPLNAQNVKHAQSILIDGSWDLQDIIEFSRRFRDVYAAEYLLSPRARTGPRDQTFNYLLKGGYVYATLFDQMSKTIPKDDQVSVKTFQYASPGIIEMNLNEEVAASVTRLVHALGPFIDTARELYREIYRWQVAQDKDPPPKRPIATSAEVEEMLQDLTSMMGFIDYERLSTLTGGSVLQIAKVVLACFRRIDTLVRYEAEGKAKLVGEVTEADVPGGDLSAIYVDDAEAFEDDIDDEDRDGVYYDDGETEADDDDDDIVPH